MAETNTQLWADYIPQSERTEKKAVETTRKPNDQLDKNSFLLLLITQMKYQDPLNPVDDKEFIAQMAQFSALEQMQNLNTTMTNSQTFSLIGKYVAGDSYNDQTGEYTEFAGRVDSVIVSNKVPYLFVNNQMIKVEDVTNVFEDENLLDYQLGLAKAQTTNAFASQNIGLIGKYIQAITVKDGEPTGFVEGRVDYVKLIDGTPVLVVGNKDIYPSELISVSDKMMLIGKNLQLLAKKENEDDEDKYIDYEIKGVEISKDKAWLVLDSQKIEIDKIDAVTEALKFIGKQADTKSSGIIDVAGVTIKEKVVYLVTINNTTVKFSDVIRE